jgi:uncharacterized iron-regulated membrane protein
VIAVCLSGTIYVYNTELTEMASPHLYEVEAESGQKPLPVDSLAAIVELEAGAPVAGVSIPADAERTYRFNVQSKNGGRGGLGYMVNPYTGEIVGNSNERNGTQEFMRTMFSLHRWLLLDRIKEPIFDGMTNRELGSKITGWATIIFTLGCITGLVIWFPQRLKSWKQGLKIKWRAGWKRVNHDLHNTLAFYSLFFLLLMGLTGPQWSFPWYREGLQKTLGTYKPKDAPKEKPLQSIIPGDSLQHKSLSIAAFVSLADKELDYEGNYTISFPADSSGVVSISKTKTGFFAPAASDRLTLDQYSGQVLKKDIFKEKPINQRIAGSIKAIHVGNVYGGFTKLLYFLACLVATSLPITGTLIWWNKRRKC